MQFDWNEANTEHIARHNVTRDEAEQVIESNPLEIRKKDHSGELRIVHVGETHAGRILLVAVTSRGDLVRVVTAYTAPRKFRTFYVQWKANTDERDLEDT